jgi:hypothetical protein
MHRMIKSLAPKWLRRLLALGALIYFVFFTFVWGLLYTLILSFTGQSVLETSESDWCKPGDWVLENLQPLDSDARMIEHWRKHKDKMTQVAEMASARQHVDAKGLTKAASDLYDSIDIYPIGPGSYWSLEPYSVERAREEAACLRGPFSSDPRQRAIQAMACSEDLPLQLMEPKFGKTHEQFFCTTRRHTFKQYMYFPGGVPRIENGRLLGPVWSDGTHNWTEKVVPSTDHFDGRECILRQLDERWFISLC